MDERKFKAIIRLLQLIEQGIIEDEKEKTEYYFNLLQYRIKRFVKGDYDEKREDRLK